MNTFTLVSVGFGLAGALAVYIICVRPILVHAPILSEAFKAEATYLDQIRAKMAGWKTKIASRFVLLSGLMVGMYDSAMPYVTGQDWTPITDKLPKWAIPLGLMLIGWLFSYLRHVTENPPQVVTQKTDDGLVQVVALNKPPAT